MTKKQSSGKQRKLESALEVSLNTLSGMVIAYCTFHYILAPALDIPLTHSQNVIVTVVLTAVSMARSYVWRRLFANNIHRKLHSYLSKKDLT